MRDDDDVNVHSPTLTKYLNVPMEKVDWEISSFFKTKKRLEKTHDVLLKITDVKDLERINRDLRHTSEYGCDTDDSGYYVDAIQLKMKAG